MSGDVSIANFVRKVRGAAFGGRLTCSFEFDVFMKDYTSFKIGGSVPLMFFPHSQEELCEVFELLEEFDISPFVLGRGTNLLVMDVPLDIIVVNTLGVDGIRFAPFENGTSDEYVLEIIADAGVGLNTLANFAYEHNLTGLEFAHGIPGTLGGGIMMNAGAYDGEMKDVVTTTTAMSKKGQFTIHGVSHNFGHRHSIFIDTEDIITSAHLTLEKSDPKLIKAKMDDYSKRRRESQPLEMPSAGSVFKKPKQGYAAQMIEQAGLKGYSIGDAEVSKKHAGFIINRSKATFSDVMSVIEHVQDEVLRQFGVELEPEVKVIRNA